MVRDHRVVVVVELPVVDVCCAVVVALVLVEVMTVMVAAAASGCWFVVVIQVSAPLTALVKSVLSAPSVIPRSKSINKRHLQQSLHRQLLLHLPRPLPRHLPLPLPLLMMFHLRLALRHQRSLVRQSLPSRQLDNYKK
jgi:hypothetical protein